MRGFTQFFTHDIPLLSLQLRTRDSLHTVMFHLPHAIRRITTHDDPCCCMQLGPHVFPPDCTPGATPVHMLVLTLIAMPVEALVFTPVSMRVNTPTSTPVTTLNSTLDHPPYLIRLTPSHLTRLLTQIYLRFTPRGIQQVVQESC